MKLLITGNSGYIGSVLGKFAQEQGHFVVGADVKMPAHSYYDEFVNDDIINNTVAYEASNLKVDAVFHLAASADVTHSTIRPSLYYHNNIGATSKLFDNLLHMGWKGPVVFSSTASVYGFRDTKCKEDDILNPKTAYGKSKLMCETYFNDLWEFNKIPAIIFRYFNVAGGYGDVGDHLNSNHVLQRLCYSAYNGKYFNIFGDNYNTSDGTCVRDFLHVLDVCRAHFTALEYLKNNPGVHTFNLGTGQGNSVKELTTMFDNFTGENILKRVCDPREGDPGYLVADSLKFQNNTSFVYNYSSIENIIKSAWEWYRSKNNAV